VTDTNVTTCWATNIQNSHSWGIVLSLYKSMYRSRTTKTWSQGMQSAASNKEYY